METLESLAILQNEEILSPEYVQNQTPFIEEMRAGINNKALERLHQREIEDWGHFGKMKQTIEARLKESQDIHNKL